MHKLIEAPLPPNSHYVGILYSFRENEKDYILTVLDEDRYKDHINMKLPGGTSEKDYEFDEIFDIELFKTLKKLEFGKVTISKIIRNERKRNQVLEGYKEKESLLFVLRTMVMESLEELGYYPMDIEPNVVDYIEKDGGHLQYFIEVKHFLDSKGDDVLIPSRNDNFKPLDPDVIESRFPLPVKEFQNLIHSHKIPVGNYLLKEKKITPEDLLQSGAYKTKSDKPNSDIQ